MTLRTCGSRSSSSSSRGGMATSCFELRADARSVLARPAGQYQRPRAQHRRALQAPALRLHRARVPVDTVITVCLVYHLPAFNQVKLAGYALLGVVALALSVATMVQGGRIVCQLNDSRPMHMRHRVKSKCRLSIVAQPSVTVANSPPDSVPINAGQAPGPSSASENPLLDPNNSTQRGCFFKRKSAPGLPFSSKSATGGSGSDLGTKDDFATRRQREASEASARVRPVTRLVIVAAVMLLLAAGVAVISVVTPVLNTPAAYACPLVLVRHRDQHLRPASAHHEPHLAAQAERVKWQVR